ncbi:SoxR reducing system RseC family protein [Paraglaciecola aestuariivivens]
MIKEVGKICAIEQAQSGQVIWVETQIKTTCGSCQAQNNCGTGAIAKVLGNKTQRLKFNYDKAVKIGQQVSLGVTEESLLKASMLMYLLPMFVLLCSALAGTLVLPTMGLTSELWIIGLAGVTTYLAMRVVKYKLNRTSNTQYSPQILQVLPDKDPKIVCKQL